MLRALQTNGEEECAAAARKTLQGRTPNAHRYMLADIQQVTDTDVAQTTSYILCPASRGLPVVAQGEKGRSFYSKVKNASNEKGQVSVAISMHSKRRNESDKVVRSLVNRVQTHGSRSLDICDSKTTLPCQ